MSAPLIDDMKARAAALNDRATHHAMTGQSEMAMRARLASNALYKAARDLASYDRASRENKAKAAEARGGYWPCNIAIADTGDVVAGPFATWAEANANLHHHAYMGAPLEIVDALGEGEG